MVLGIKIASFVVFSFGIGIKFALACFSFGIRISLLYIISFIDIEFESDGMIRVDRELTHAKFARAREISTLSRSAPAAFTLRQA
jgi:hypothetical protein